MTSYEVVGDFDYVRCRTSCLFWRCVGHLFDSNGGLKMLICLHEVRVGALGFSAKMILLA